MAFHRLDQHIIQRWGRYPFVEFSGHGFHFGHDLGDSLAGQSRQKQHRSKGQKLETQAQFLQILVHGLVVFRHQIPLVDGDDHRPTALVGIARHGQILIGHPVGGIDDHHHHMGPIHRLEGLNDTELFQRLVGLALAPNPRGINQHVAFLLVIEGRIDAVPGGAGGGIGDHPLVTENPVDQGGLADVRAADNGQSHLFASGFCLGCLVEQGQNLIDQIPNPAAMLG